MQSELEDLERGLDTLLLRGLARWIDALEQTVENQTPKVDAYRDHARYVSLLTGARLNLMGAAHVFQERGGGEPHTELETAGAGAAAVCVPVPPAQILAFITDLAEECGSRRPYRTGRDLPRERWGACCRRTGRTDSPQEQGSAVFEEVEVEAVSVASVASEVVVAKEKPKESADGRGRSNRKPGKRTGAGD
ncbi:hypothetical protein GCM10011316_05570 [Roseibium aquae]|uniref:Uncharacterized protein n=1 Tax=Roseibium aquae TaxID=1323746 RepID=A0A916TAI4_9HYPH|nr:hypothetical protein [Roseibium aquae]GGB36288.1 hypothetical protein GCM10011316_05570 [Roseibium aquae]